MQLEKSLKIIDNFLVEEDFNMINNIITNDTFPWHIQKGVSYNGDGGFFLCHKLYDYEQKQPITSPFFKTIMDLILKRLRVKSLIRAKLNLYPMTKKIEKHAFHIDQTKHGVPLEHNVALLYLNTNNGKTLFKNKSINSIENRMVLFNGMIEHASTTCTNKQYRTNININYVL
jgi:hypothetical protein